MKTQIKNTVKVAFLMLVSITIFSCSKSDDAAKPVSPTYSAPVSIDFNGDMYTSTINITKLPADVNLCNNYQAIVTKLPNKLGFAIYNFNANGGALDKDANGGQDCGKMQFSGESSVAGGSTLEYYNNVANGGNITLVGKTYTMTCNTYLKNDPNAPRTFVVKATWTRP
jgi:hypothetical protein